jgi:phage-related protein
VYTIEYYEDNRGRKPVKEYLDELNAKEDKNSRINYDKTQQYLAILRSFGTKAGMPYIKHIDGAIWELRPINERIFFIAWINGSFLMLHHFTKKSQKTPPPEIETAKRRLKEQLERSNQGERHIH